MPDPLQLLLDIQDRDLVADQLRHRRTTLPERVALTEQQAAVARVDRELVDLGAQLAEVQRAQKRLEDEVATLDAKAAAENTKMYSGTVTSPRELQAMQEEIEALGRRQRTLEDELLDLMEKAEPLSEEITTLEARRVELSTEGDRLTIAIADNEVAIDAELAQVADARTAVVADLPADLLATYEKLRPHLGGIAVARLEGTQCTGCHLSLPATELDAVRRAKPGEVAYHEECGRILVR